AFGAIDGVPDRFRQALIVGPGQELARGAVAHLACQYGSITAAAAEAPLVQVGRRECHDPCRARTSDSDNRPHGMGAIERRGYPVAPMALLAARDVPPDAFAVMDVLPLAMQELADDA